MLVACRGNKLHVNLPVSQIVTVVLNNTMMANDTSYCVLQSLDQRIKDCGIRAMSPSDALDETRAYTAMEKALQLLKSQLVSSLL